MEYWEWVVGVGDGYNRENTPIRSYRKQPLFILDESLDVL